VAGTTTVVPGSKAATAALGGTRNKAPGVVPPVAVKDGSRARNIGVSRGPKPGPQNQPLVGAQPSPVLTAREDVPTGEMQ
jgi:hypothetical protein